MSGAVWVQLTHQPMEIIDSLGDQPPHFMRVCRNHAPICRPWTLWKTVWNHLHRRGRRFESCSAHFLEGCLIKQPRTVYPEGRWSPTLHAGSGDSANNHRGHTLHGNILSRLASLHRAPIRLHTRGSVVMDCIIETAVVFPGTGPSMDDCSVGVHTHLEIMFRR